MARLPCLLCMHWVEDAIIGKDEANRLLAEHKRVEHGPSKATFPPERELYVLPPLRSGLAIEAETPPGAPLSVEGRLQRTIDIARLDGALAPEEPDDAETRAYLDALRMVAAAIVAGGVFIADGAIAPTGAVGVAGAILFADIRRVVGLYGRTIDLGGVPEGRS